MAKVSKPIQSLFLRFLNFPPDLLHRTQLEARKHNIGFDAFIRASVDEYLKDLAVAREHHELRDHARLTLRAHFAEDRNEFLTDDDIRAIGS